MYIFLFKHLGRRSDEVALMYFFAFVVRELSRNNKEINGARSEVLMRNCRVTSVCRLSSQMLLLPPLNDGVWTSLLLEPPLDELIVREVIVYSSVLFSV